MRERLFGKYRGEVEDVDDPQARGRLRARVPEALGDTLSGWALPCAPFGGDGLGFFAVPERGAGVWVEFEAGDPSRPIWSGCWWQEGQAPGEAGAVVLSDGHGNSLRMTRDGVEVQDTGGNKITAGTSGVVVTSAADVVVKATGNVTVEGVNLSARAQAQMTVEGSAGAEISSSGQTVVKGSIVRIN